MPFYEYIAKDLENSCEKCRDRFIEMQGINDAALVSCPDCGGIITKCISLPNFIVKGKQPNQYNDVKGAKYWRDKNGVRHRVTAADGHSNSPTSTSKQFNSPEKIKALKAVDAAKSTRMREQQTYNRFVQDVKQSKKGK